MVAGIAIGLAVGYLLGAWVERKSRKVEVGARVVVAHDGVIRVRAAAGKAVDVTAHDEEE
jgi:hypothetical protein